MPNESAKIILAATHGKLSKVRDCLLIEDSINSIQCQFEFRTSDWDNTSKTAVFVRGWATPSTPSADMIVVMLDENNECIVPHEVLNKGIAFSVGVFGSSDGYRIVSNWMYYKIKDGCFAEGSSPIDPSPTVYEQILEALKNKSNVGHNHDERYYTKEESDELLNDIESAYTDAIIEEKNRAEGIENGLRGDINRIKSDYLKSTDKEEIYNNINNKVNRSELDAYAKKSDVEGLIPDNIATNEYVDQKVSDLVSSAPEALDTLQELSKALGDDPNFATTIATELGNKVDKVEGKGLSTNDYTNEEKEKLNNISPSDWNATEGSTQILNKPTKLSQFEGEMTADEQTAVREKIGANEVYIMDESDTEADIPENAELIIIPDENGNPTEYVTVEMLNNIIPTVTSNDNGKFLRVSGGKIVCESLPAAEEASF